MSSDCGCQPADRFIDPLGRNQTIAEGDAVGWRVPGAGGNALLCYGLVAMLFSAARVKRGYMAMRRPIDRLCGALMAVFGVKLIAG